MKINYFYFCLLFLFSQLAFSQTAGSEFGKYSLDELQKKRFDKDTISEAAVLSDVGESFFVNDDGNIILYFKRTTRYKVFSEAGLKYAEVSIPFYIGDSESEQIVALKGNTVNIENGGIKVTPLDSKNCFVEKNN